MSYSMPSLPPFVKSKEEALDVQSLDIDVTANAAAVLSNLGRDDGNDDNSIDFGGGGDDFTTSLMTTMKTTAAPTLQLSVTLSTRIKLSRH